MELYASRMVSEADILRIEYESLSSTYVAYWCITCRSGTGVSLCVCSRTAQAYTV